MDKLVVYRVIPAENYSYFQFENLSQTREYIENIQSKSVVNEISSLQLIKDEFEGDFAAVEISCVSLAGNEKVQSIFPKTGHWIPIQGNADYKVLEPEVVAALDMQKSEFEYFRSGRIMSIKRFIFKKELLENRDIFLLPEISSSLFATNKFLIEYNIQKCNGIEFQKVFEER